MSAFRNLTLFGLIAVGAALPASAQLAGDTFSAGYYLPNDSTVYGSASFTPSTFIVGAGVETIGNVEGVTNLIFDFSDSTINLVFDTTLGNPTWGSASFNGPIFTSLMGHGGDQPDGRRGDDIGWFRRIPHSARQ